MSFVGKTLRSVGKFVGETLGLVPETPPVETPPPAPTMDDKAVQVDLDRVAQTQAASMSRGRTSTVLSGNDGFEEDEKATSKILLGK